MASNKNNNNSSKNNYLDAFIFRYNIQTLEKETAKEIEKYTQNIITCC